MGSEMCIRDRLCLDFSETFFMFPSTEPSILLIHSWQTLRKLGSRTKLDYLLFIHKNSQLMLFGRDYSTTVLGYIVKKTGNKPEFQIPRIRECVVLCEYLAAARRVITDNSLATSPLQL